MHIIQRQLNFMKTKKKKIKFSLKGKIFEIYKNEETKIIKIKIYENIIELKLNAETEYCLEDELNIECDFNINKFKINNIE